MSPPTYFPLNVADGKSINIPSIGFGTFGAPTPDGKSWCKDAILEALNAGYRHLDCAWAYGVDSEIGEAIRESGIPRSEIFVTTKFWMQFAAPENVELCLDLCLKQMGLDYVDLYLAHFPYAQMPTSRAGLEKALADPAGSPEDWGKKVDPESGKPVVDWEHTSSHIAKLVGKEGSFVPTWKAMEKLVRNGKTRAIGVSNFSISDLQDIIPHAEIPISCNQVEVHPWLPNTELINFSKEHGILTTCFSPFAGQKADGSTLLKDPTVLKLAAANNMDAGQLLQSWAVQRGTVPLGKSSTPSRIRTNFQIKKLSDEDMDVLDSLEMPDGKGRTIDMSSFWDIPLFQG